MKVFTISFKVHIILKVHLKNTSTFLHVEALLHPNVRLCVNIAVFNQINLGNAFDCSTAALTPKHTVNL